MKRTRSRPGKGSYRHVPAGFPPIAPRRGVNSQKESAARNDRKRAKRVGALRRAFSILRTLVIAMLALAALGGGGLAAFRAYEDTGLLVLREVRVEGNRLLDRKSILDRAGVELGTKLPAVPVERVEAEVRSLAAVADVEVRRVWPSRLEIRVSEVAPVACGYSKGWRGLAPDGTAIPGIDLRDTDLPVVDGFAALRPERRAELGAFLDAVRREHPAVYASFSQLTVLGRRKGPADLEIVLRDGRLKVLVEMGNKSLNSLEFLQALVRRQKGSLEPGKTIDLRVEGYAYVR